MHEGFTINALTVNVKGTLDLRGLFMIDDVSAGFKDLRYDFHIESPDEEDKLRELAEKVVAHCPVVDSLRRPTPVSGEITVTRPSAEVLTSLDKLSQPAL